jgi:hypothetical protein
MLSRTRLFFSLVFVACLTLGLAITAPAQAGFEERVEFDAQTLRLANLIGAIQVEGTDGDRFEVTVSVRGKDASRDLIEIKQKQGREAELLIIFPLDEETHYVYPELGHSKSSFAASRNFRDKGNWWSEIWDALQGNQVHVSGKGKGLEVWADVVVRVPRGGKLETYHGAGETHAANVEGDLVLDTHSGGVEARGIRGSLNVDTGSGSVRVTDVKGSVLIDTGSGSVRAEDVDGEVNVDTGSGGVDVIRCRSDRVLVDTGSGSVDIEDLVCRSLKVDTGSGGISASDVEADDADLDTGSGSVELKLSRMGTGDFVIDTGSGGITLAVPSDASARVRASAGSGGVRVDFEGENVHHSSRHDVDLQIGEGGADVQLETGSGSIHITG